MFFGVPDTPDQSPFRLRSPGGGQRAHAAAVDTPTPPRHHDISGVSSFGGLSHREERYEVVDLRREVTHLRLRLVYLDELLARAGLDLDMADEASRATATARAAEERIIVLEASLRDFEQRNAHLAGTIATLRADVAERDATLASRPTEEAVRRAQEEASVQRATVESLKAEAAASLNVRRELEERLAAERTSWADQRGTAEALRREEGRVASERVAALAAERDQLEADLCASGASNDELRADLDAQKRVVDQLREVRASLTSELADASGKLRAGAELTADTEAELSAETKRASFWRGMYHGAAAVLTEHFGIEASRVDEGSDVPSFVAALRRTITAHCSATAEHQQHALKRSLQSAVESFAASTERDLDRIASAAERVVRKGNNAQDTARNAHRRVSHNITQMRCDLREERDRRRADGQRQVAAAITRIGEASCDRIEHVLRHSLEDVRAAVLNTNVLTDAFIGEIDNTVRSASKVISRAADLARASGRSGSPGGGGGGGASSSDVQRLLDWGEDTSKACQNIVALLRTNLDQAARQEELYAASLERTRSNLNGEMRSFRRALDHVLSSPGAGMGDVPHAISRGGSPLHSPSSVGRLPSPPMSHLVSPNILSRTSTFA
jgi:hypothetical protein